MSRVKFGKIVTAIVTGYFGPKNCHGLLGASRVSFSKIVTGTSKNVTGKKKTLLTGISFSNGLDTLLKTNLGAGG